MLWLFRRPLPSSVCVRATASLKQWFVQVQKAGQHKTARSVEDIGGGRPVACHGGNPPALEQHPVIAQHLLRAIPARQHVAAEDRNRFHAGFTFQKTVAIRTSKRKLRER